MTRTPKPGGLSEDQGDCCGRRPRTRALDLDAATARRDPPCLMAMARTRRAGCVVTALQLITSAINSLCTRAPTPTLSAISPYFAAPASSPRRLLHTIGQRPRLSRSS